MVTELQEIPYFYGSTSFYTVKEGSDCADIPFIFSLTKVTKEPLDAGM
jgi:hypothetical protein